jgi:hypothetical protein
MQIHTPGSLRSKAAHGLAKGIELFTALFVFASAALAAPVPQLTLTAN